MDTIALVGATVLLVGTFFFGYLVGFGRATDAEAEIRKQLRGIAPPVDELLFFHDDESMVQGRYDIFLAKMVDVAGNTVAVLDLDREQMKDIRDGITTVLRLGHNPKGAA